MRKLEEAAKELADFTFNICKHTCKSMGLCCTDDMCKFTLDMLLAIDKDHPNFIATEDRPLVERMKHISDHVDMVGGSKTARFLNGDKSCGFKPYMRPNCTKHQCDINAIGYFKQWVDGVSAEALTEKYFDLDDAFDAATNECITK